MHFAKISARGQTTIPKSIRDAAELGAGDLVVFEIEGDRVVMRKALQADDSYLRGLTGVVGEWTSPEDEAAWHDL